METLKGKIRIVIANISLLILMLTGSCFSVTCPVGYSANRNICYKYHKSCYTWEKASEACVTAGGFLYKIADDESYQLINSLVDGNGLCDHGVWVGSRREADGSFKWRDNTLTDLNKFWAGGQPDGPGLHGESCVEIRNNFGNLMNDRECSMKKGFVCQAQPIVTCPVGYSANGNICYKYHKSCYTWEKASEACVTAGGFLYKIADDESYQLINSLVDGNGLCDHGVWVGSRREADGSFKWRDNTLTDLNKFWAGGQPDGPGLHGESCVEIRNNFGNLMNDRECSMKKGFVCQAQPIVTCPVGYSANGNICYKYHKSCYTWEKASEACVTAGGFLYKIADDESYQLINSLVDGNGLCDHGVWVGSRREADGSFKWRDNTLTDLNKFWAGGQPDGPGLHGESCVEIRNNFGNLMNDRECSMKKGFVCQAHPDGCPCRRSRCLYNEYEAGKCSNGIRCCRAYSGLDPIDNDSAQRTTASYPEKSIDYFIDRILK